MAGAAHEIAGNCIHRRTSPAPTPVGRAALEPGSRSPRAVRERRRRGLPRPGMALDRGEDVDCLMHRSLHAQLVRFYQYKRHLVQCVPASDSRSAEDAGCTSVGLVNTAKSPPPGRRPVGSPGRGRHPRAGSERGGLVPAPSRPGSGPPALTRRDQGGPGARSRSGTGSRRERRCGAWDSFAVPWAERARTCRDSRTFRALGRVPTREPAEPVRGILRHGPDISRWFLSWPWSQIISVQVVPIAAAPRPPPPIHIAWTHPKRLQPAGTHKAGRRRHLPCSRPRLRPATFRRALRREQRAVRPAGHPCGDGYARRRRGDADLVLAGTRPSGPLQRCDFRLPVQSSGGGRRWEIRPEGGAGHYQRGCGSETVGGGRDSARSARSWKRSKGVARAGFRLRRAR